MKQLCIGLVWGMLAISCTDTEQKKNFQYPVTAEVDTTDVYFGTTVADPYRWLEDDNSEATKEWVTSQNALTFDYLRSIPFRESVKERLEEVYNYERMSAPKKHGDYLYFYRNDGLQNQNVLFRKKEGSESDEVFLDPNTFKEDGTISLGGTSWSDDGSLFAYLISEGGSDWRKAIILDTKDKSQVDDTLRHIKFSTLSWNGNEGFYYTQYEKPAAGEELSGLNTKGRVYYHEIGTDQSEDKMIFEPEGDKLGAGGYLTEDNRFLVIFTYEGTSGNKLFVKDLAGTNEVIPIIDDFDHDHSVIATKGDKLLIYTNLEAPNYRVVEVDPANPAPNNWKDIIPTSDDVLEASAAGGFIFANYLQDAKTAVKQFDFNGTLTREVELPGIGSAFGFEGKQEDKELYYVFSSFTYPSSIFKYDIAKGTSGLFKQPSVDFDPEAYETKQVFYNSKDGTRIPMFIVHKKGIELDGKNPTYLYAYGGFNISLRPSFSTSRIVWLENGGIYAQPNIRGGGEYGKKWHEAGTKMQKQNVFDDFIAAGEYLVEKGYTSRDYMAIAGGSNGGLLVGATMTQRPDLAKVAFPMVGVMDMLRYHKFTIGWAWATDYGTSEDSKEMFEYLKGYSPVHNLRSGTSYPATMVTTADHDDRVVPAHSFKFAATLQKHHAGDDPVLIRIETDAGHGAGTPISKTIEGQADIYSFAWYNMGVIPPLAKQEQ